MKENGLGADVVSEGELRRALLAGFPPSSIVFAGVGKKEEEIEFGVKNGILCFNVENEEELNIIEKFGRKYKKSITCNLRLNPDVGVKTHSYIKTGKEENKFGIDLATAEKIIKSSKRYKWVKIKGLHFHLGSQIKDVSPFIEAIGKVKKFCLKVNFKPEILDIGGGFGIPYRPDDRVCDISEFGKKICDSLKDFGIKKLIIEPGRFIVGNGGVLIAKVLYVKRRKRKNFIIVDAGMNDLIRPSLYHAYHMILPAKLRKNGKIKADVVGPICETGDYLGKDIEFPSAPEIGDFIVVMGAGAYCFTLSSNYNSRPRPCEILVNGKREKIIREREKYEDLWRGEK